MEDVYVVNMYDIIGLTAPISIAKFAECLSPHPFIDNRPYMAIPSLYVFSEPTTFDNIFLTILSH